MLIEPDSPFVNLPRDLHPKQALFLDGIRFAAEMAELAYARLCNSLFELSTKEVRDNRDVGRGAVAALLDAWSIVDAINRLRDLQHQMPGLKKNTGFKLFMRKTEPFAELRDIVQHLNNEIDEMAKQKQPVWGSLRWFTLLDQKAMTGRSCVLVAGRIADGTHPLVNPAGRPIQGSVDHVTLSCKGKDASLSEGLQTVAFMVRGLEPSLKESFRDLPRAGTDILFMADMRFFDPETAPPK